MKFERVNDQQIRCTITSEDLAKRRINLSELAYGSEKARSLFSEMMEQASFELDFETDNMPILIEAVPMSGDSIVLTVTKVDDPEELDTRFSQFSPALFSDSDEAADSLDEFSDLFEGDEELSELFKHVTDLSKKKRSEKAVPSSEAPAVSRIFSFDSMDACISLSHVIPANYTGESRLYKLKSNGRYLLYVKDTQSDPLLFNRVCNIMSEYGSTERSLPSGDAFLSEHAECIIKSEAIQKLAGI